MNRPASKDPSMDEILTSIRQIIDNDQSTQQTPQEEPAAFQEVVDEEAASGTPVADDDPMPLSVSQVVETAEPEREIDIPMEQEGADMQVSVDHPDEAGTDDPYADALSTDFDPVMPETPAPETSAPETAHTSGSSGDMENAIPDEAAAVGQIENQVDLSAINNAPARFDKQQSAGDDHGLPDPTLADDIAGQLLEPTTHAAASHAFSQLDALTLSRNGQTLEGLVGELLRPMLKGWLDENLPGVVEKLVQREIQRVSRGKN